MWSKRSGRGTRGLYAWQAVPPSTQCVALGMVFTTSPEAPPQAAMRCVPVDWVVRGIACASLLLLLLLPLLHNKQRKEKVKEIER